jgi:hypothetical protein
LARVASIDISGLKGMEFMLYFVEQDCFCARAGSDEFSNIKAACWRPEKE